jgi:rhamnosyltransferase
MATSESFHAVTSPVSTQAICAVIVTYFPDAGIFERVKRIVEQVRQTVIVDNGSSPESTEQLKRAAENPSVHLILNPSNQGLASALNLGVRWAASCGFAWALTLDQDTTVAYDMAETLCALVDSYDSPERLAVVGSNYRNKGNGALFRESISPAGNPAAREMVSVLTSGSLVSVAAFQAIGGFRDDFFIDCIDHEFCLRARVRGFHVVLTTKPVMDHGIGELTEHRFLGRIVYTSNHSPLRHYFMTRNSLLLIRSYLFSEPGWILSYFWDWMKSVVLILVFEEQRFAKAKQMLRGCLDGLLSRTRAVQIGSLQ